MSKILIVWVKQIEEHLCEMRIFDVAVKVFTTVWGFYKKIRKKCCDEAVFIAIVLAEISVTIRTEETVTKEAIYSEKLIMKKIYESTIKTITTTKITTSTMKTCQTLTSYYVRTKRWSEAITIYHEMLKEL